MIFKTVERQCQGYPLQSIPVTLNPGCAFENTDSPRHQPRPAESESLGLETRHMHCLKHHTWRRYTGRVGSCLCSRDAGCPPESGSPSRAESHRWALVAQWSPLHLGRAWWLSSDQWTTGKSDIHYIQVQPFNFLSSPLPQQDVSAQGSPPYSKELHAPCSKSSKSQVTKRS